MGKRARRQRRQSTVSADDPGAAIADAVRGRPGSVDRLLAIWSGGRDIGGPLDDHLVAAHRAAVLEGWTSGELARIAGKQAGRHARRLVEGLPALTFERWRQGAGPDLRAAVVIALQVLGTFVSVGEPPAAGLAGPGEADDVDAAVLDKVRALLAKAESTTFPAEAEALSAKAHQLMARHAIDAAFVRGGRRAGAVAARRIGVDEPYVNGKARLVMAVAAACGCRAVWCRDAHLVVVLGHPDDLRAVDLLHTSLLVQATAAMLAAGADATGDRTRSRGFRSSFLLAYGQRIGLRLREATDHAVAEATAAHGDDLLPVLASKERAVDEAVEEAFPRLRTWRPSASDAAGWRAGDAAAARADLGSTRLPPRARELTPS